MLNREIGHRLKNAFAMVQALAKQTLRPVQDRGPVLNFEQRLQALSSAHDILLGNNWANADVRTALLRVVDTLGMTEQVEIRGKDISVNPKGALSLSLLLHELTTNAVKYGSLSSVHGRVLVSWDVQAKGRMPSSVCSGGRQAGRRLSSRNQRALARASFRWGY